MKINLFKGLKQLALLGLWLLFLPTIVLLYHFLGEKMSSPVVGEAMLIGSGYIGYVTRKLGVGLQKRESKILGNSLSLLLYIGAGGICFLGIWWYYRGEFWLGLGMTGIIGIGYVLGLCMAYRNYEEIYTRGILGSLIVISIVSSFFVDLPIYPLIMVGNTMVYLLIENQKTIDNLLVRTRKNVGMVHPIRRYNMQLVGLILGLIGGAYCLKGVIADGLEYLGELLRRGFVMLMGWLAAMMSKNGVEEAVIVERLSPGQLPFGEEQVSHPLLDILLILIGTCLAIWMIKKIVPILWRKGKVLLEKVKIWVNRLLEIRPKLEQEMDYYDQIENVEKDRFSPKSLSAKKALKKWQKELKLWDIQENTKEKYRGAYGLILKWIKIKGHPIRAHETSWEIYKSVSKKDLIEDIGPETKIYNEVVYGSREIEVFDIEEIRRVLENLDTK